MKLKEFKREMKIMDKTNVEEKIRYNHIIIRSYLGHYSKMGIDAYLEKNPYWLVQNKHTNEKYILIYCDPDVLTKVDENKMDHIKSKNSSWYLQKNGYISTRDKNGYLHAHIITHYENGKGQDSVDHINRQKLDNRSSNLRIVDQSEQNRNRSKRLDAKTYYGTQLPRYVSFYEYTKDGRDNIYFYIDCHPRIKPSKSGKKSIRGSKSFGISHDAKLEQILSINKELNHGIDSIEYDLFDPAKFYQDEFEKEFTYDEYMKNLHLMTFSPQYDEITPEIMALYEKYVKSS